VEAVDDGAAKAAETPPGEGIEASGVDADQLLSRVFTSHPARMPQLAPRSKHMF